MTDVVPNEQQVERRRPAPLDPREILHRLPAVVLLDRLAAPALAAGGDGVLIYVNGAFADMVGFGEPAALIGGSLAALMISDRDVAADQCVELLRDAGSAGGAITSWRHRDGHRLRAVVSEALLTRRTDPLLLVTLTDVTDHTWNATA